MAENRTKLATIARNIRRPFDDVLELWIERAAIREYEGGATRRDAESAAYFDVANMLGGQR